MEENIKKALSVKDMMEILDISRQKLYDEITSGRLQTFRIGTRRKTTQELIDIYIENRIAETRYDEENSEENIIADRVRLLLKNKV